jgi:hypothetical protein
MPACVSKSHSRYVTGVVLLEIWGTAEFPFFICYEWSFEGFTFLTLIAWKKDVKLREYFIWPISLWTQSFDLITIQYNSTIQSTNSISCYTFPQSRPKKTSSSLRLKLPPFFYSPTTALGGRLIILPSQKQRGWK